MMIITLIWSATMFVAIMMAVRAEWKRSEGVLSKILLLFTTFISLYSVIQIFIKFLPFWG